MSVQAPPLTLTLEEYRDNTTNRLHFLVTQLVSALGSNDLKGTVVAISTFVRYFTFVLEIIENSNQKTKTTNLRESHNIWAYPKGLSSLKKGMSAQAPPLPLLIADLKDKRTKGLNRLVTKLVLALASNDPQGIIAVISTFVQYFTSVLEVLETISKYRKDSSSSGIPNTWTYPVVLRKRLS